MFSGSDESRSNTSRPLGLCYVDTEVVKSGSSYEPVLILARCIAFSFGSFSLGNLDALLIHR